MATPQLSPGVLVREVDLTVGRADNVLDNIGVIAGPFKIGPVDDPVDITTEQELIATFGKPLSTDSQFEYWMSASSFLSYGGVLKVCRSAGPTLANANAGTDEAAATMTGSARIDNYDDYLNDHTDATNFLYAAKTPGTWANNLKVCFVDDIADQIVGIATTSLAQVGCEIGVGVTVALADVTVPSGSAGTLSTITTGYLKGVVTGVTSATTGTASTFDLKIVSRVDESTSGVSTETEITYAEGTDFAAVAVSGKVHFVNSAGVNTTGRGNGSHVGAGETVNTILDWYDQQTLGLTNSTVYWKEIAPKPSTNKYSLDRKSKNDAMHIVVVDDLGTVSGIQGQILEKHVSLSKASDSISAVNSPEKIFYEDYLGLFSDNIYAGGNPGSAADTYWSTTPRATGFTAYTGTKSASFTPITTANGTWNQDAQGVTFSAIGNKTYTLTAGVDYSAAGGMKATLGDIITSYGKFANKDEVAADYIIMGPGFDTEADSKAKAGYLISLAGQRKDCVTTIGPHRANLVGVTNTTTQTDNLIKYFSSLASSSYGIFDSGYKYTYDRFNNKFRWVPTNADIAGLMVRTNVVAYPWFSPAGQQRGIINNAVKLAYNPNKAQRDRLYPARINAVVTQPGIGTLLFGDKTALGYASAFDRINVRRLFLTVEQALQRAAEAQLFELNDELTRANFRNIVEPYLRDVQAKRGLYGFLVVCDSTNNTPDVIDNNEFRADIFLKPAKAINYVTLTFVATRTGVSFDEVVGRV
jgi:hypothetical protein